MGEKRIQVIARVFEAACVVGDRKPHGGWLVYNAKLVHQCNELGVSPVVVDDKACIDVVISAGNAHTFSGRVSADTIGGLENRDRLSGFSQSVGAAET